MEKTFKVWNADNMPVQAPFYKSPSIPYGCKDLFSVDVYCRAPKGVIQKMLEPTPFEWVSDDFLIDFGDYAQGTSAVYNDMGIVVPVKYKNCYGGYYLFEYEDLASSVAAGRELWGYPKKVGDFKTEKKENGYHICLSREGTSLADIFLDYSETPKKLPTELAFRPHLLLYTMPRYAGPGVQFKKILERDTSPDYIEKSSRRVSASVQFQTYINPPVIELLGELGPEEVYGAIIKTGDFSATQEHGWAKLVDVIVPDPD